MPIRVVRNENGNCVNFVGSSNPVYFNACLGAEVDAQVPTAINVINNIASAGAGRTVYEFYRIEFTEFRDADNNPFATAQDCADYIALVGNAAAGTDVAAGYRGVWDAATNDPDISATSPNNGDWYFVNVAGDTDPATGAAGSTSYAVNDIIKYSAGVTAWGHIPNETVRVDQLDGVISDILDLGVAPFDWYVNPSNLETGRDGSAANPFNTIEDAIISAASGDSILIEGDVVVSSPIVLPSDKSLKFFGGGPLASVGYASFDAGNGDVFEQSSSGSVASFEFRGLTIRNAGGYGVYIRSGLKVDVVGCTFTTNGWSGSGLSTTEPEAGGVLGYDSDAADLQAFYAGAQASNGGAMRIRSTAVVNVTDCTVNNNLRGIRVQDCGVGGAGVIARNRCYNNIESGIYLAAGSYSASDGCENFSVYNNFSSNNANNGILIIGGANNLIALNRIEGCWNAGFMLWHVSDTRARDMDLDNNNRSDVNGIGNLGDAQASIQVAGDTIRGSHTFLCEVLDTTVHNTGTGSATQRNGMLLAVSLDSLAGRPLVSVDDVSFLSQDIGILAACNLDNVRLSVSDCRFTDTAVANVSTPGGGAYHALPFSNLHVDAAALDFSLDATGSRVFVKEAGRVVQSYGVNELQAVAFGTEVRIMAAGGDRIQWDGVPVSGLSIDGVSVNSVLAQALVQLNDLFSNTGGFASAGNPVTNFALTGNSLTLTLQDGTAYTVDVTTLGVDENTFVSSGALVGSNLVLTMSDASEVTINAANMINTAQLPAVSENWVVAYGSFAGTEITANVFTNSLQSRLPLREGGGLERGREFIWQHDEGGTLHIGTWSGSTTSASGASAYNAVNWATKFRITPTLVSLVADGSVGIDIASRFAAGYTVSGATLFALRHGNDGYLTLYDISDGAYTIVAQSTAQTAGDTVFLHITGQSTAFSTKIPVLTERTDVWTIAHDEDSSEAGEWADGIEANTVLQSNVRLSPGQKAMINVSSQIYGNPYVALDYSGGASGESDASAELADSFRISAQEGVYQLDGWTFNTGSPHYDNVGTEEWEPANGTPIGMLEIRYFEDNTIELYSVLYGEVVATLDRTTSGEDLNVYFAASSALGISVGIPDVSLQSLTATSQPVTQFAPDYSDQAFDISELSSFSVQLVKDSGGDEATFFAEVSGPSWAVLDQKTGTITGTAPMHTYAQPDTPNPYPMVVKAANPVGGSVTFTVTLNVQDYSNTTSLKFQGGVSSYLGGNAALVPELERSGNGTGSGDAWSVSLWIRRGDTNTGQTIFYFGANDVANAGYIEIKQTVGDRIRLRYGSNNNNIQIQTASGSLSGGWSHVLVTYDGGTTGASSADISSYYSRFRIFIDGTETTGNSNSQSNYGWTGAITGQNYRIGRLVSGNYPNDMLINQIAIWGSDQSANIGVIYNSRATQDLRNLSSPPDHYYEVTDSVTLLEDIGSSADAHLVGYNFTSADLVNNTPP